MKPLSLVIIMLLIFNGCAFKKPIVNQDDAAIRERVNALWTAKKEKQWENVYGYYCDAFKQKKSKDDFIKSSNLEVNNFSIVSVEPWNNFKGAEVLISFESKTFGIDMKNIQIRETWAKEGRQWYACPSGSGAKSLFE